MTWQSGYHFTEVQPDIRVELGLADSKSMMEILDTAPSILQGTRLHHSQLWFYLKNLPFILSRLETCTY